MQKKTYRLFALFIALVLLPITAFADLAVTFFDVGQGDSSLIQADGKNIKVILSQLSRKPVINLA